MAEDIQSTRNLPTPAVLKTSALVTEIYNSFEKFQPLSTQSEIIPNATYFVPFYGDKGPANVPVRLTSLADLQQFFQNDITIDRYGWAAKQAHDILSGGGGLVHVLAYNLRPTFGGTYTNPDDPTDKSENKPGRHAISVLDVSISGITPDFKIQYRQRSYDPDGVASDYTLLSKLGNIKSEFDGGGIVTEKDGTEWHPLIVMMDKNPGTAGNNITCTITPFSDMMSDDIQMYKFNLFDATGVKVEDYIFTFDRYHMYRGVHTYLPFVLQHVNLVHSIFIGDTFNYIIKSLGIDEADKTKIDIFGSANKVIKVRQDPNNAQSPMVNKTIQVMQFLTSDLRNRYGSIQFNDNSIQVADAKYPLVFDYGYDGEYIGDNSKDNLLTKLLSCEDRIENSEGDNIGEFDFEILKYPAHVQFDTIFDHGHYDLKHMELLISLRDIRFEYDFTGPNVLRNVTVMNAKGGNMTQVSKFMDSLNGGSGIRRNDTTWVHGYSAIDYNGKFEDVYTSYQLCMKQVAIDYNTGPFYFPFGQSRNSMNGILNGKIDNNQVFLRKNADEYFLNKWGLVILNKNPQGDVFINNNKTSTEEKDDARYFIDINRSLIYMYNHCESIVRQYQTPEGLSVGARQAVLKEIDDFFKTIPTKVLETYTLPEITSSPLEIQRGVYIISSELSFRNNAIKFVFDFTTKMANS